MIEEIRGSNGNKWGHVSSYSFQNFDDYSEPFVSPCMKRLSRFEFITIHQFIRMVFLNKN